MGGKYIAVRKYEIRYIVPEYCLQLQIILQFNFSLGINKIRNLLLCNLCLNLFPTFLV